jgi:hypothetical protein
MLQNESHLNSEVPTLHTANQSNVLSWLVWTNSLQELCQTSTDTTRILYQCYSTSTTHNPYEDTLSALHTTWNSLAPD